MALKITCPHCGRPTRLEEPYPLPGTERQCACGRALAISYPVGLVDVMRKKGARFADDDAAGAPRAPAPAAPRAPAPPVGTVATPPRRVAPPPPPTATRTVLPGGSSTGPMPTDPTVHERLSAAEDDRTRQAVTSEGHLLEPPPTTGARATPPPAPPRAAPTRPPAPPRRARRRGLLGGLFAGGILVVVLGVLLVVAAVAGVGWYYSRDLPSVEALRNYRPATVTTVYDDHDRLIGELYQKRRYVVPLDAMPKHLKDAFIAAEDAAFFEHSGVDVMGMVRAGVRNLVSGRKAQGASTITQQVARNFLLTKEKTYARKIREILLARRIDDTFDKEHVLYLYLNEIYLGSGAYGVEAAARVYFGKHVGELDLAEAAMIAGLPQRPSDYSPHRHFDKAKARQRYVLDQLVDKHYIDDATAQKAADEPLDVVARKNEFLLKAPWFSEHVRRYLVEKYGEDRVYNEGLEVHTTCDLDLQTKAQQAVTDGVTGVDEKSGWRGAKEHLDGAAIAERAAEYARKYDVVEGERYDGVVVDVQKKHLVVDLGEVKALVPLAWTEWAYTPDPNRQARYRHQDDLARVFKVGDVLTVDVEAEDFRAAEPFATYADAGDGPYVAARVYQPPVMQGALYSYRLGDGAVVAMVGGVDFKDTQFNRAVQAQRQVGSTFKPIVYAAAIASKKFTAATIVPDAPLAFNVKTAQGDLWKPENFGSDYLGDITLRKALALSRNVVTVRVLEQLGVTAVYEMARKLGITSPMSQDLSMGLGSASLYMPELARAYSAFATAGRLVEPHYVNKVVDRDGDVLEVWQAPPAWEQVLDPGVATVMNWMLGEVCTAGTAAKAASLGLHVGGKTGTTNDFKDAWFVGFTPDLMTAVWVGYDQPRSLGENSTGGYIALPIWMDYVKLAQPKEQDRAFPGGPVSFVGVDETTGAESEGGRSMPFLPGTSPRITGAKEGQKTSQDLLTSEW